MKYNLDVPYKTVIVPQQYECNLPALAKNLYGDSKYWDLLYFANDMSDPMALRTGQTIKVPTLHQALNTASGIGVMT